MSTTQTCLNKYTTWCRLLIINLCWTWTSTLRWGFTIPLCMCNAKLLQIHFPVRSWPQQNSSKMAQMEIIKGHLVEIIRTFFSFFCSFAVSTYQGWEMIVKLLLHTLFWGNVCPRRSYDQKSLWVLHLDETIDWNLAISAVHHGHCPLPNNRYFFTRQTKLVAKLRWDKNWIPLFFSLILIFFAHFMSLLSAKSNGRVFLHF